MRVMNVVCLLVEMSLMLVRIVMVLSSSKASQRLRFNLHKVKVDALNKKLALLKSGPPWPDPAAFIFAITVCSVRSS